MFSSSTVLCVQYGLTVSDEDGAPVVGHGLGAGVGTLDSGVVPMYGAGVGRVLGAGDGFGWRSQFTS